MFRILSCVTLAALAGVLHAADRLTLTQALDFADRSHPLLGAGVADVDAARAGILTARAFPNPQAGFSAGRQTARIPSAVAGGDYLYAFSQPLELGRLRPTRIELARRGQESSEFALSSIRLSVLSGVRRAFYGALRRKSEIGLAEQNLRLVEDLRQRIQVRVNVGEAGRLELSRAEAELATARTYANSTRLELVTAMSALQAAIGAPLAPDTELEGALDAAPSVPSLEALRQELLDRHPALALARSEVNRAEARLGYERALRTPQPSVFTEIETLPDNPTYRAGISIPIPFWNRREGPIAEAAALERRALRFSEAQRVELLAALDGAYGRYQVASQQLASFEQGVLKDAEEALQGAETAYQLGERGILEVLDAQRVLRTVRQDYLNAQYERQSALIDIDQLRAEDLRKPVP